MTSAPTILVSIHYPVDVGFAIGRLITAFYDMAERCSGNSANVHFAFTDLRDGLCKDLPADFSNYLQFEPRDSSPEAIGRLTAYIRKHKIDVLFGMDMPVQAPYLAAARRAGVKTVISYFGAPLSSVNSWPLLMLKRLEVHLMHPDRPDHFIVESQAMYRTAVFGRGLPQRDVSVVRNGVSLDRFKPLPDQADFVYQLFSIPRDRKIVAYMGHFHQRKGVNVLLGAAHRIVHRLGRGDLHFLFLGTRPQDVDAMRQVFDFATVALHVCLGGYQERIPEILAGCTLGCIPTTGWDSFPMSPLEMQACGLPVIVSDCQGLPETVVDGVTGLIVPAGNENELATAILALVDDPVRRSRMGSAARHRIENELNFETQVTELSTALLGVLNK